MLSAVLLENVESIKSTTSHAKRAQKVHNFPDEIWSQKLAQLTTRKSTKKTQRLGLKSTTSLIIFAQQQQQAKEKKHLIDFIFGTDHNFSNKKTQKVHNFPDDLITKISTTNLTTSSTKKAQKVHNFPDDLITKSSTTNSTTNHKKKHKKKHNV